MVHDRWKKVLRLIIAGNGDNSLVESARGQLLVPLVLGPNSYSSDSESDSLEMDTEG